jgi:hypothetical protein
MYGIGTSTKNAKKILVFVISILITPMNGKEMSHNKIILVIDVTSLLHLWSCCINHNISAT